MTQPALEAGTFEIQNQAAKKEYASNSSQCNQQNNETPGTGQEDLPQAIEHALE